MEFGEHRATLIRDTLSVTNTDLLWVQDYFD